MIKFVVPCMFFLRTELADVTEGTCSPSSSQYPRTSCDDVNNIEVLFQFKILSEPAMILVVPAECHNCSIDKMPL